MSGQTAPAAAHTGARILFRQAGRLVLRTPADRAVHEERIRTALDLEGVEPLQGAVVDMLVGCAPGPGLERALLDKRVQQRLAPVVLRGLLTHIKSGQPMPRVNKWATRWSVLASPSLDVPSHALLCGSDDSRTIVANTMPALLAGDTQAEEQFLAHCLSSHDVLAFMLARKELGQHRKTLSPDWEKTMEMLQQRTSG